MTSGLTLALNVEQRGTAIARRRAKLQEIPARRQSPAASPWPALELSADPVGRRQLRCPPAALPDARCAAGIFDRSEISGLDARLAGLQRDRLRLDIGELRLAEINPGFTFGPPLLRGHYEQPSTSRGTPDADRRNPDSWRAILVAGRHP